MIPTSLSPSNTVFIILSFEGPDRYSLAGGLGIRVANITRTLADMGFPTHLFFIGDPKNKGEEHISEDTCLHRWCQWISEYYPKGVYEGEPDKIRDFNKSVPPYIIEHIARPAIQQDKVLVILGEEWHTAETMWRLSDQLFYSGLRDRTLMFWNANNTFGFDRINWKRLEFTSKIMTVSRYMKHIMQGMGLNPLVIPNGIPLSALQPVDERISGRLRNTIQADSVLAKVARWDPDKCWDPAIDAVAHFKANGKKVALLARGGIEPYGKEVMYNARVQGLKVKEAYTRGNTIPDYLAAIDRAGDADVIDIKFHCPPELLQLIYHTSDAVLANSRHEPFGLVGLETMAAGGVAFTGGTGEDYATPFYNSIVLGSRDSQEIEDSLAYLEEHPAESNRIRQNARETAEYFTWERVIRLFIRKIEIEAQVKGIIKPIRWNDIIFGTESRPNDELVFSGGK
jgi:glycosyltransferase involved in cell wall biosynthesis